MIVTCNSCDWRSSSASSLAELSFIFDHEHRFGTVHEDDGPLLPGRYRAIDSEHSDPGGTIRFQKLERRIYRAWRSAMVKVWRITDRDADRKAAIALVWKELADKFNMSCKEVQEILRREQARRNEQRRQDREARRAQLESWSPQ